MFKFYAFDVLIVSLDFVFLYEFYNIKRWELTLFFTKNSKFLYLESELLVQWSDVPRVGTPGLVNSWTSSFYDSQVQESSGEGSGQC